ncbi:hypothetical protein BWZ20_12615 [Winogradskyella sp. J14-2]|uniref:DUF3667 domain-containing protein n=1 Tax=Winogradskyella sp. J14-2 TaxID=1936080 RepID=UPI000972C36E|nr:DUF3667 domain-containing protein [Winogradskyella sp. J14-2]APY09093.1 hypothetical protein BWZ20_12615 [Winogradskyella sp. J14-2]
MNCKNCNTELKEQYDYCSRCGGKVIRNRLTLKNLFTHLSETFFNYDNKLLQTFIQLFKKPEDVIVGYINGTRKKYVNVISYFALAITLSGLQIYVLKQFQTEISLYDLNTEIGKTQQAVFDSTYSFMTDYQSLIMMLYIPIYALIARLTFMGIKTYNYTELIVIFLYGQAQLSICIAILTVALVPTKLISFEAFGLLTIPIMVLYFTYCLKRVYGLSFTQILLRSLLFIGILIVLFVIITIASTIIMYYNGSLDAMIESKRAEIEATKTIKDTIN